MPQGEMCTGDANAYGERVDKEVGHAGMAPGYIELNHLDQAHEPNQKQGHQNGSTRVAKSERKSHEKKSNEVLEAVGECGHRPIRRWNEREDGNCEEQEPGGDFTRLPDPGRGHMLIQRAMMCVLFRSRNPCKLKHVLRDRKRSSQPRRLDAV